MNYPIDVEQCIASAQVEFGPNERAEEMCRAFVPLVNDCYGDGLVGRPFAFQDMDAELAAFHEATGKEANPAIRKVASLLIAWCRQAYVQGRKEAVA